MTEFEREKVHVLWDKLSTYPSAEIDAAQQHLLATVCDWIGADDAIWLGAIRTESLASDDYLNGWRVATAKPFRTPTEAQLQLVMKIRRQRAAGEIDVGLTTHAIMRSTGRFRVKQLRDGFVDFDAFQKTSHYHYFYEKLGVSDRLWIVFPLNADAESYFLFDRINRAENFSPRDMALAGYVLRGIRWYHRQLFLSHGLGVAQKKFTPTQRKVVHSLLTGRDEKQVADELGQSAATVHKHIENIYRALGVSSRSALMALWLSGK